MIARAELHALVDALPDELPEAVLRSIKRTLEQAHEHLRSPLSPERERELREARDALDRGEGIPADEAFAEFEKLAP